MSSNTSTNNSITFSIIIPTYNRPQALARCLDSLTRLDYVYNSFEVIVVDDGSQVSNESVLAPFYEKISLRLFRQKNAGPAAARNAGAIQAKGTFLVFTDDDCIPAQNWLGELETNLAMKLNCMVGGRVVNGLPANIYAQASHLILDIVYAYYNAEGTDPHFIASNNMAVPASAFRSAGGFDASYPHAGGEDREFCDRWLGLGYGMTYASKAIVNHYHDLTLLTYWKQHVTYGRGAFRFNRSHARSHKEGSTLQMGFYASFPRRFYEATMDFTTSEKWCFSLLMIMWQAANSVGFLIEMIKYLIRRQRIR